MNYVAKDIYDNLLDGLSKAFNKTENQVKDMPKTTHTVVVVPGVTPVRNMFTITEDPRGTRIHSIKVEDGAAVPGTVFDYNVTHETFRVDSFALLDWILKQHFPELINIQHPYYFTLQHIQVDPSCRSYSFSPTI